MSTIGLEYMKALLLLVRMSRLVLAYHSLSTIKVKAHFKLKYRVGMSVGCESVAHLKCYVIFCSIPDQTTSRIG